jgi:hypothetical protein
MTIEEFINISLEIVNNFPDVNQQELYNLELNDSTKNAVIFALTEVEAITPTQGTPRVYIGPIDDKIKEVIKNTLDILKTCLECIYQELTQKGILSKKDITEIIEKHKHNTISGYSKKFDYYRIRSILSSLALTQGLGSGRSGGFTLYSKHDLETEIANTEKAIEEVKEEEKEQFLKRNEHVLYPLAAGIISSLGYEPIVTGGKKRFEGQWSTPDVIGYRVNRFDNIVQRDIEVVTVEVKWEFNRQAIAESISHQRLGHKTYLMVHQSFYDIDKSLLNELINKGVGLICLKEGEHILYIEANRNNSEKRDIDTLLGQSLEPDTLKNLRNEMEDYISVLLANKITRRGEHD